MKLKSGEVCPRTGSYQMLNRDGKILGSVYVGEGETMPPTPQESCFYEFSE